MVGEQISNTIEIISKIIEANLQNDQQDEAFLDNKDSKLDRRKSIKMDTTMMSEMDYINMLPQMDIMDIEDSSFLKSSFLMSG